MRRVFAAAVLVLAVCASGACKDKGASCHTQAHGAGGTYTYCA